MQEALKPIIDPRVARQRELVFTIHERLVHDLDVRQLDGLSPEEARAQVIRVAGAVLDEIQPLRGSAKEEVLRDVANEVLGLGPLQPLLDDTDVSEVMVNGPTEVYFERNGLLHESDYHFRDQAHIRRIADRIVTPVGRRLDESSPMVDARLADGSRVNIVIPPVSINGTSITIRKFRAGGISVDDLIRFGSLTEEVAAFMQATVIAKVNLVIAGGTGSGKTTLLNALSSFLPEHERIVTVEDPVELQLLQRHVVALEARPPGVDGKGEVSQRDLVRNALRMRPDRIIVGEVRGAEAFDMMQAMNTGHEGSITTIHANTPRDACARIENMLMMAGFEIPIRAIREQMSSALHVIVQSARLHDGSRRVTQITEVVGIEGDIISLQDIFVFVIRGTDADGRILGELEPTGLRPKIADRFSQFGLEDPWTPLFAEPSRSGNGRH